jgi:hypothetical protein
LRFTLGREESVEMSDGSLVETTFRQLEVTVSEDKPETNCMTARAEATMTWPEIQATVTADLTITGTANTFDFDLKVEVFNGERPTATKTWKETIPRKLV